VITPITFFTLKPGTEGVVTITISELMDLVSTGDPH
jgi:hypothetical protein